MSVPDFGSDEAIRSALVEQCIRSEPAPSNAVYSEQAWQEQYERRWILPNMRYMRTSTEIDGAIKSLYCRVCALEKKHGRIAAFKLHVTYSADPMQVAKHGIIVLECNNCGFEMVHHRKPRTNISGYDANGVYIDEAAGIEKSAFEQMLRKKEAEMRMSHMGMRQGKSLYDPRMAAQGIGGNALSNHHADALRYAFENQLIPEAEYQQRMTMLHEEAKRRINAAVNPPIMAPVPKGPFDPP